MRPNDYEYEEDGVVTGPANVSAAMPDNKPPMDNINQGTIAIESQRAVAEAQGKLIIAKKFPRDPTACYAKIMESCQRPDFAEDAFFSFPRGGQKVEGPTIRFAEELARCWGNVEYGIKELSRDDGKSEMQAYAWDTETNTLSVQNFANPHLREVRGKMVPLTTERDIYELNANMAARRLRARILSVLPSYLVEDAVKECKKTLAGKNDTPLIDRVNRMVTTFKQFGVTQAQIEKRLGRPIETMSTDDLVDYMGIYNSLKNGMSKPSEWFATAAEPSELDEKLKELTGETKV